MLNFEIHGKGVIKNWAGRCSIINEGEKELKVIHETGVVIIVPPNVTVEVTKIEQEFVTGDYVSLSSNKLSHAESLNDTYWIKGDEEGK